MPTETDVKIAGDLADFRVEMAERFGKMEAGIAERFGKVEAEIGGFRASVETEMGLIRKLGDRILGALIGGVGTMVVWAALAGWYGSAIHSDVRQQGTQLDAMERRVDAMDKQQGARFEGLERRVDAMDKKLDTLISRTTSKAGG